MIIGTRNFFFLLIGLSALLVFIYSIVKAKRNYSKVAASLIFLGLLTPFCFTLTKAITVYTLNQPKTLKVYAANSRLIESLKVYGVELTAGVGTTIIDNAHTTTMISKRDDSKIVWHDQRADSDKHFKNNLVFDLKAGEKVVVIAQ
ncbi:hypothetical protein EQG49_01230 [Periweissella cryptocerci]|uniref:Uncharacterized protein n=1 Tax=Periweissella cryptocerci TaxID=2506420 RepID=A0A4P6YRE9_9LACO|nr:hypothetical protein [Periweissella cryptocerci]QBO35172.1 hypothetical protein EQG49_01230 [Periweissella cryptocerci]